jgi:hypothetical protein
MKDSSAHNKQETMDDLINALHHHNRHAGALLAQIILTDRGDEGGAYQAFVRALTQQLRHWSGDLQFIQEDDLVKMMRAAARELEKGRWGS